MRTFSRMMPRLKAKKTPRAMKVTMILGTVLFYDDHEALKDKVFSTGQAPSLRYIHWCDWELQAQWSRPDKPMHCTSIRRSVLYVPSWREHHPRSMHCLHGNQLVQRWLSFVAEVLSLEEVWAPGTSSNPQIVLLASCTISQRGWTDKECILQGDERVAIILQFHIQMGDLLQVAKSSPVNDSFGLSSDLLPGGLVQLEPCVSVPVICIDNSSIFWRRLRLLNWTMRLHFRQFWRDRRFLRILTQSRAAWTASAPGGNGGEELEVGFREALLFKELFAHIRSPVTSVVATQGWGEDSFNLKFKMGPQRSDIFKEGINK